LTCAGRAQALPVLSRDSAASHQTKKLQMHEVKIYDSAGKLKRVISVKTLNKRSEKQFENPSLFKKKKGNYPPLKTAKATIKTQAKKG
jgi:hypothetical protein